MKQKLKTIIIIVILLSIGIWIIDKIPFNKNINQKINANIWEWCWVSQAILVINGEKATIYLEKQKDLLANL